MMVLTILNLLMVPSMIFSVEERIDENGNPITFDYKIARNLIIIQTIVSIVYLIDLIIMILVFGLKDVLIEKSTGLQVELILQIYFIYLFFK